MKKFRFLFLDRFADDTPIFEEITAENRHLAFLELEKLYAFPLIYKVWQID